MKFRAIDSHHHIWLMDQLDWLNGPTQPRIFGDYEKIRRDYPIQEFKKDARPAGIVGSVYIQVNWPENREIKEVKWIQSISKEFGWPNAMIGYVDFSSPNCASILKRMAKFPVVRGIRQQLHWHEKPLYRFANAPDIMMNTEWRKNFCLLQEYGWIFELQVFTSQMANAAKFAKDFKETPMILQHCGMPEDVSISGMASWTEGIKRLADQKNVNCKFSGLGTFQHKSSRGFIEEITGTCIEFFGPSRCMFGSNFPIEKIWTSYKNLILNYKETLKKLSKPDQDMIFFSNARDLYKLQEI